MSAPTVSTVLLTSPNRGSIHQIYGVYLGESSLNNEYCLAKVNSHKFISHLRNFKQAGIIERNLMNSREDSSLHKFNGKVEVLNTTKSSEMGKEVFIESLKDKISYYGLHNFSYLPGPEKMIISLLLNLHTFYLQDSFLSMRKGP